VSALWAFLPIFHIENRWLTPPATAVSAFPA
jgi:hypothetical protein